MSSKTVKEYVSKLGSPQKEIVERLREIVLKVHDQERMKNGVPWYDWFYIVGLRDHVNLGFSVLGLSEEQARQFEGKGKYMRHLKFSSVKDIDEAKVLALLKMVKKNARCEC